MSAIILSPREAGKFIAEKATNLKIVDSGIETLSNEIVEVIEANPREVSVDRWSLHELLPQTRDEKALNWVFVSDVLNFSFWSIKDKKFMVKYAEKEWTGYWSMCAALCRAIDEGHDMTNASFLSSLDEKTLQHIFRSDSDFAMPLMQERLKALKEAGTVLQNKFDGKFGNVVREAKGSAQKLLELVVENFESFRDEVEYAGKKVAIYKRAQIVVGDAWACMRGMEPCNFHDIHLITAFADYRVPQALAWMGVLLYEQEFLEFLKNENHMLKYGEDREVEIRGCTIHAVELLVAKVNEKLQNHENLKHIKVNSIMLDHYLWDLRRNQDQNMPHIPFHKVRCIYY